MYEVDNTEDGLLIEELLSGEMMRTRPELTWKYLAQIAQACQGAIFNRGHEVIAAFDAKIERTWVLTQNVDGFHRAAGSSNVIDIHGDMHELWCTGCSWRTWLEDFDKLDVHLAARSATASRDHMSCSSMSCCRSTSWTGFRRN